MKIVKSIDLTILTLLGFVIPLSVHATTVNVNVSANPIWTDTAIALGAGNSVTITASGTWSWNFGSPVGPDGDSSVTDAPTLQDEFFSGANKAALIAYVGADPTQGHLGDATFFPQAMGYWNVGTGIVFNSPYAGELWLGLNDDPISGGISDNSGFLTAQIEVVPEPATMALVGFGGLSLSLFRRRK